MCQKYKDRNIMINILTIRMRNKLKYSDVITALEKLKDANISNIITILTMLVSINFEM